MALTSPLGAGVPWVDVRCSEKYEHGEMLLYRALILEESGLVRERLGNVLDMRLYFMFRILT